MYNDFNSQSVMYTRKGQPMASNEPQEMEGLSVVIPRSDKRALEQLAREQGNASLAVIVRRLIRNELERQALYVIADAETEAYLRKAQA